MAAADGTRVVIDETQRRPRMTMAVTGRHAKILNVKFN